MKRLVIHRKIIFALFLCLLMGSLPAHPLAATPEAPPSGLSEYKPIYFLYGRHPDNVKFQISMKYKLFNKDKSFVQTHPWMNGIHIGYTQLAFWDLDAPSQPFRDTSYEPELFGLYEDILTLPKISRNQFLLGIHHESNGQDETNSRALNYAFIEPRLIVGDVHRRHFAVSMRVWRYVGDLSENPDIRDYRGYGEVGLRLGDAKEWLGTASFRKGRRDGKASVQLDLTYPTRKIFSSPLDLYLHAQYFSGYGESLLGYNQKSSGFRFGFTFLR